MPNILRILRIDEVSLVDKGASGNARSKPAIVIAKRKVPTMATKKQIADLAKLLATVGIKLEKKDGEPTMTIDEVLGALTPDQKDVILAALQMAASKPAEPAPKAAPPADEPPPEKPAGDEPSPEEKKPMPAMKRADLPEDVRKALDEGEQAKQDAAELRKRLDAIEEKNEAAEFLAKAADLKYLAGASTAEISKALRAAKKSLDEKEYATFVKLLQNANEAVRTSKLFAVPGNPGDGEGDSTAQLDTIAKKMVADGKAKTYQEALRKALKENPGIYAEHKAEISARARTH